MSFFGKVFGGKKEEPPISTQQALQKLSEQEEMLLKKHDYLQSKVEAELSNAKAHGTKNKRQAILALKRKKQYDQQMVQIDGILNTIQNQRSSLENASMNSEILQVISQSSKALKAAHNQMNVDQVHDLMEDIAEQHEVANEIATAISNPVGLGTDIDEDELLQELEHLEEEELEHQLLDIDSSGAKQKNVASQLPKAPTDALPSTPLATSVKGDSKKKQQEDDDLAELEAWANA